MQKLSRLMLVAGLVTLASACQKELDKPPEQKPLIINQPPKDDENQTPMDPSAAAQPRPGQVQPPMDVAQPPADAIKTPSGMFYKVLAEGQGEKPGVNDTVLVAYTGWRTNGEMFYSTERRGTPQPMSLTQLSKGWEEALRDMKVGDKRIYWMPTELATRGTAKQGTDTMMVFQIENTGIEAAPPIPSDVAAPPADATKTKSGLAYKVLQPGKGTDKPQLWDQVTVSYTFWSPDGKMIDSTTIRKRPRPMQLYREPAGMAEAVMLLTVGQKARVWIPESLLDKRPGMPAGGLTAEIELVDLKKMPQPPPTPKDVAAPPKDAKKTASGLAYKVLKKGTGKEHPTPAKTVKVHYTGWTTDGRVFDSSVSRGQPAQFPLQGVIAGWTEGLQLMVVGESTRFWIPEELAYKGMAGRPKGMLVFDVELLEITDTPAHQLPPGHAPAGGQQGAAGGHGGAAGGGGHGAAAGGGGHGGTGAQGTTPAQGAGTTPGAKPAPGAAPAQPKPAAPGAAPATPAQPK